MFLPQLEPPLCPPGGLKSFPCMALLLPELMSPPIGRLSLPLQQLGSLCMQAPLAFILRVWTFYNQPGFPSLPIPNTIHRRGHFQPYTPARLVVYACALMCLALTLAS